MPIKISTAYRQNIQQRQIRNDDDEEKQCNQLNDNNNQSDYFPNTETSEQPATTVEVHKYQLAEIIKNKIDGAIILKKPSIWQRLINFFFSSSGENNQVADETINNIYESAKRNSTITFNDNDKTYHSTILNKTVLKNFAQACKLVEFAQAINEAVINTPLQCKPGESRVPIIVVGKNNGSNKINVNVVIEKNTRKLNHNPFKSYNSITKSQYTKVVGVQINEDEFDSFQKYLKSHHEKITYNAIKIAITTNPDKIQYIGDWNN